jgi:hypothetical protein
MWKMDEIKELLEKAKDLNTFLEKYVSKEIDPFDKQIEDGMINNLHNANDHQLGLLLSGGYRWRYYKELNKKENLENLIKKVKRLERIEHIKKTN